ncbi:MAG: ribonuclease J [Dehalococcoidia bacterium]|nr:ribonuclease J [Dehalococcoidia bacterium]
MTDPLRIIPLGGLGEIGKNMMALECGDDIVIIDCGLMFPEEDMLGVDLVIPDISYLERNLKKLRGILITHGHEDHTGALPYVLPRLRVPVYAVGLAHGLIQTKLREHRQLRDSLLQMAEPGVPIQLGAMRAEFFRVCHSIPDAMGIALTTPQGLVIHTGDFKIDHTPIDGKAMDFQHVARLCENGLLLLCSDSTYAEVPGFTKSEAVVADALGRIIREAPGRVVIATFASLISRVQVALSASEQSGRKMAVLGRSMVENVATATKMGYLQVPQGVLKQWDQIRDLPPEQIVIMTTGSQGEPTSGLVRIANKRHEDIRIIPGDTVVLSASPIPGNETVISRTIDNLARQGARVLSTRNAEAVHVHGHASQEDLKLMLRVTQPKYFVPVHGEYRHLLAHSELAQQVGVPTENVFVLEDGYVLELDEDGGKVVDQLACGHVYVDGLQLWDPASTVLRDRKMLSMDGMVLVVLTIDQKSGILIQDPEIVSSGFIEAQQHDLLASGVKALVDTIEQKSDTVLQSDQIRTLVKETLGKFLYTQTKRRPMIFPVVVSV